jgi:hypothetical protein
MAFIHDGSDHDLHQDLIELRAAVGLETHESSARNQVKA